MLKGSIKDKPIATVFLELYTQGATGTLRVKKDGAMKNVYFQMGKPVFASSNMKEDRMGSILYRKGIIERKQLEQAIEEIKRTGKKLGTILVERGVLTPEELVQAVIDQVTEIILSLFQFEDGEYFFSDELPSEEEVITLDMSAAQVIVDGVRKKYPIQKVKQILGSPRRILAFTKNPSYRFHEIELSPDEERVISMVNGKNSISEIQRESGTDEETCYRIIAAFMLLRSIDVLGEKEAVEETGEVMEIEEIPEIEELEKLRVSPEEDLLSGIKEVIAEAPKQAPKQPPKPRPQPQPRQPGPPPPQVEKPKELRMDPQEAKRLFEKGKVLFQDGETEAALDAFKKAISLDPTISDYYTGIGLLYATKAEEDKEYETEAIRYFKKAIALNPREARNYYYLGVIFKSREDFNKARGYFSKAVTLNPDFKQAQQQLDALEE